MVYSYEKLFQSGETGEKEVLIPVNVSMVKIEVKGSGTLVCTAMLDRESDKVAIGAINAKDFSNTLSMTEGLYTIEVSGYYKIFFTLSGASTDVYIKAIC